MHHPAENPAAMKPRLIQLIRYGGTAGVAAIVDILGFGLLHSLGWHLALAAAMSFLVATVVNYGLSARFVFAARVSISGYLKFLIAALLGFCINVGLTILLAQVGGLTPVLAKLAGVGVAFFANFALNARYVFGSRDGRFETIGTSADGHASFTPMPQGTGAPHPTQRPRQP